MALQATGITGDDLQQIPAVPLLLCIIACVVGVCLAVVLAEYRLGRPLVALGRRTLPVYVSNEIVLGCLTALMVLAVPHVAERIGWLAVPALVIVALPLTLLLQRVSSFAPWLYEAPIRMTRPVPGRNALAGRGASRGCLLHRRVRS